MNFEKKENQILTTFISLGVNILYLIMKKIILKKFDAKSDEGIFLRYVSSSKAYGVFNKKTLVVEESINVIFYESNDKYSRKEDILDEDAENLNNKMDSLTLKDDPPQDNGEDLRKENEKDNDEEPSTPNQKDELPKEWRHTQGHLKDLIIDDLS